ncbi:MAG: ATP-dependent zinc metalloprotease FtsH [Phycisphaerae bacterium]|nr:ATP-dependent zinc metalloprotease FtsH [Phycisphaerae bacterium]NIX31816.1 ATP-dependent zinc metalloprotease FtsH [Phycisphaerae bacterium]
MERNEQPEEQKRKLPTSEKPDFSNNKIWRNLIWLFILTVVIYLVVGQFGGGTQRPTEISYTTFRGQLKEGNVEQVTVTGEEIEGELKEPLEQKIDEQQSITYTNFITYLPSFGDENLLALLEEHDVEVQVNPPNDVPWWSILLSIAPFLFLIVLGYLFFSQMQAQGRNVFSMAKSRAKLYDQDKEQTTFDDVAGVEGAKTELEEIIDFLKDPKRFEQVGGEIPKGVLLVGPPGTGKTLLARAVAGEAEVPFFNITGSDFMEMFVGVGASRVRDMFNEAKRVAPSVIFIDELDSIGRRRGAGLGGGHDEREQTLNQLLSELDGFEPNENVIVMAATNRPDILDPALLRPGRFDRQITVDLPTLSARQEILKIHARDKPLANTVDLERLARGTPGFSGADLKNMLNEAALLAARKNKQVIEPEEIEGARDKILMGLERENMALSDEELKLIAYHEAGHAVIAAILPNADPIHKVTIVPRGHAMGVTQQLPEREKFIYPREYMLDRLAVMMGGRAAEDLVLGTATSGAENDLKEATKLARKMVLDWGMSERLGRVALGGEREQVFLGEEIAQRRQYSETTAREIDEEIKATLDEAYERAIETLREHYEQLNRIAETLLAEEEIPGEKVLELLGASQKQSPNPADNSRLRESV